jgi:citrate lyase subunit beta/citryl-CoA lyase
MLGSATFMRSLMFVPGHRQRMVDRALGLGEFAPGPLDVALLDLEDGVAVSEKDNARGVLAASLERPSSGRGPARYVRINAVRSARRDADLAAVVRPGLAGILAPKVDLPEDITLLSDVLDEREAGAGLGPGTVRILAAIESAIGLLNAPAIAASSPRVVGLMFGAEDFALDIGLGTMREGEAAELVHARSAIVIAAASAHRLAFDGVWPDIKDASGLRRDSLQARRLGFAGKSLIHPGQIDTINEIFSPSADEIDYARRVLAAFEEARARGDGAIALGGQLLDLPIVERARRTLSAHEALEAAATKA